MSIMWTMHSHGTLNTWQGLGTYLYHLTTAWEQIVMHSAWSIFNCYLYCGGSPTTRYLYGSASEVNRSGADAHSFLVTIILLSFILLLSSQPSSIHLDSFRRHLLSSESSTSISIMMASCAASAKEVRKLCVNLYISIINLLWTDRHTYIQAQPQTNTPLAPAVPAQLWASR